MLFVIETYRSIQGESSFAGMPCTFVRLAGCNLRCTWCDSEYTFSGGKKMSWEEIEAEVNRLARLAPDVPLATDALAQLLVAMPVYRSYLPIGAEYLREAIECASRRRPDPWLRPAKRPRW